MNNTITLLTMSAIATLSLFAYMPNSDATSHTCSLSSHCYAVQWLEWNVWGLEGYGEEYGVAATQNVSSMSDDSGDNNFIVSSMWILEKGSSDTWVELGVIQGDYPDCPTSAETTKRYYWISWDGTYDADGDEDIEGGCVTTPSVASNTVKLEDTNKDGTWNFIVGSTTVTSFENDFGKGLVKIGMESTDKDNTADAKFTNLDYYDTQWKSWKYSENHEVGNYDITKCSADSFALGSASC